MDNWLIRAIVSCLYRPSERSIGIHEPPFDPSAATASSPSEHPSVTCSSAAGGAARHASEKLGVDIRAIGRDREERRPGRADNGKGSRQHTAKSF